MQVAIKQSDDFYLKETSVLIKSLIFLIFLIIAEAFVLFKGYQIISIILLILSGGTFGFMVFKYKKRIEIQQILDKALNKVDNFTKALNEKITKEQQDEDEKYKNLKLETFLQSMNQWVKTAKLLKNANVEHDFPLEVQQTYTEEEMQTLFVLAQELDKKFNSTLDLINENIPESISKFTKSINALVIKLKIDHNKSLTQKCQDILNKAKDIKEIGNILKVDGSFSNINNAVKEHLNNYKQAMQYAERFEKLLFDAVKVFNCLVGFLTTEDLKDTQFKNVQEVIKFLDLKTQQRQGSKNDVDEFCKLFKISTEKVRQSIREIQKDLIETLGDKSLLQIAEIYNKNKNQYEQSVNAFFTSTKMKLENLTQLMQQLSVFHFSQFSEPILPSIKKITQDDNVILIQKICKIFQSNLNLILSTLTDVKQSLDLYGNIFLNRNLLKIGQYSLTEAEQFIQCANGFSGQNIQDIIIENNKLQELFDTIKKLLKTSNATTTNQMLQKIIKISKEYKTVEIGLTQEEIKALNDIGNKLQSDKYMPLLQLEGIQDIIKFADASQNCLDIINQIETITGLSISETISTIQQLNKNFQKQGIIKGLEIDLKKLQNLEKFLSIVNQKLSINPNLLKHIKILLEGVPNETLLNRIQQIKNEISAHNQLSVIAENANMSVDEFLKLSAILNRVWDQTNNQKNILKFIEDSNNFLKIDEEIKYTYVLLQEKNINKKEINYEDYLKFLTQHFNQIISESQKILSVTNKFEIEMDKDPKSIIQTIEDLKKLKSQMQGYKLDLERIQNNLSLMNDKIKFKGLFKDVIQKIEFDKKQRHRILDDILVLLSSLFQQKTLVDEKDIMDAIKNNMQFLESNLVNYQALKKECPNLQLVFESYKKLAIVLKDEEITPMSFIALSITLSWFIEKNIRIDNIESVLAATEASMYDLYRFLLENNVLGNNITFSELIKMYEVISKLPDGISGRLKIINSKYSEFISAIHKVFNPYIVYPVIQNLVNSLSRGDLQTLKDLQVLKQITYKKQMQQILNIFETYGIKNIIQAMRDILCK